MRRRFVLRTIRKGSVRINGKTFHPDCSGYAAYDGRLDGMRYAFGLYDMDPYLVCLWGTEEASRSTTVEQLESASRPEVVDGTLPWMFWRAHDDGL